MNFVHQVSVLSSRFIWFLCFDLSETLCGSLLEKSPLIINQRTRLENALVGISLSFIFPHQDSQTKKQLHLQHNDISFSLIAHLFYSCNVVHCQFLQRALELFVIGCSRFVNNLFLPAGCSLRKEQVWVSKKDYIAELTKMSNTVQHHWVTSVYGPIFPLNHGHISYSFLNNRCGEAFSNTWLKIW